MGFDEMKNKAKDVRGQHGDKAAEGVDKARDLADKKTGNKHSDQVGKVADKTKERLRNSDR